MAHGRLAGTTGVRVFLESYSRKTGEESIGYALSRALGEANAAVYALSREAGAPGQVGSTFVAAVVHGDNLYWTSVGDSALYLFRDGALTLLSASHIYGNHLDRAASQGTISSEQALHNPQREALTSYLGIENLVEVDTNLGPLPLRIGDRAILASDGLFKTLTIPEITAAVAHESPQPVVERLVQITIEKQQPYQDNVTVLCVEFGADAPSAEQTPEAPPPSAPPLIEPPVTAPNRDRWRIAAVFLLAILATLAFWWMYRSSPAATTTQ